MERSSTTSCQSVKSVSKCLAAGVVPFDDLQQGFRPIWDIVADSFEFDQVWRRGPFRQKFRFTEFSEDDAESVLRRKVFGREGWFDEKEVLTVLEKLSRLFGIKG